MGLPLNRQINEDIVIAGTFFICGTGEEDFIGLTDAQVQKYKEMFYMPEIFSMHNGKIESMKVSEKAWGYLMATQMMRAQEKNQTRNER